MESDINPLLCMSIRSKGSNLQCHHPRKNDSEYCGIHQKTRNVIRIDSLPKENPQKKVKKDDTLEKYIDHVNQIVKIQKTFRMWNLYRRNRSNNREDCGTFESIFIIPVEYYFDYLDVDGFYYAFDIRTLDLLSNNPYNQKQFPTTNEFKNRLESKIQYIKKTERKMKHDSPKLTEEQKYDQNLIRVFQKFDMVGQYTDTRWFDNLCIEDLKKFYKLAYDMFDYRAQLPYEIRKKITKSGVMFQEILSEVQFYRQKHKRILQLEILREMEKIVDEAIDKEYKTLGVNLILTALVEVSPLAAQSLPHLVQSTFY